MNTHGVKQNQELTEAAIALSEARANVETIKRSLLVRPSAGARLLLETRLASAKDARTAARARYDAAYKAYTNPFGVVKTFS